MVEPQWGQFQKPNEINELNEPKPQNISNAVDPEEEKPEPEQVKWGEFQNPNTYQGEPSNIEQEGALNWFGRNVAANSTRFAENYLGKYGNIESLSKSFLKSFPQSTGLLGTAIHSLVGQEKWDKIVGEEQILPTTEKLREVSKEGTKGFLEPKSKGEKKVQEFVGDVGSIAGSGPRIPTARNFLINNLGIPLAGNAAKSIVEEVGLGEDKGNIAKMATWTALALSRNVNAPEYASQLMNTGRNGIPTTVNIDTPRLQNRLQTVGQTLLSADPRTDLAREQINRINQDLANGQTSVRSMMTSYDGLNAAKRNRGLFNMDRHDRDFARLSIDRVRNALRDEIMEAGANYPDALDSWRAGIQAWSVVHRSRAMTNYAQDLVKGPYGKLLTGPAAALFGLGSFASVKQPLVTGTAGAVLPAAYKGMQVLYRIWRDPNLARYYWHALGDLARENAPAFIKNYVKLNKELKKSKSSADEA